MMRITDTVKQLIIINIIFFIGTYIIGTPIAYKYLALHYPQNPDFKFWQIITHMFMHGGIPHILFNMLGLWMFGSPLEHFWGTKKFLFFYFSCGLGAAALHLAVSYFSFEHTLNMLVENGFNKQDVLNTLNRGMFDQRWLEYISESQLSPYFAPMLGASGAIYGIIVAFAFMFPNAELMLIFLPIPIKAKYFVPGLVAIDLILGVQGQSIFGSRFDDGIAHFAHLGGALIGFLMMWYWNKNKFNHNRWN
ncbi:rhomboid family intramembrane serine protease [Flavobacterium rhizosphaerae]|uniref:Rhomboid family intramembrane serine protease n=1 Tax=Flavobacterium rhizosphaerae TaxID=3163298 RepID=A0ABW8YTT1_9FLAO